jgi:hypothetical protein
MEIEPDREWHMEDRKHWVYLGWLSCDAHRAKAIIRMSETQPSTRLVVSTSSAPKLEVETGQVLKLLIPGSELDNAVRACKGQTVFYANGAQVCDYLVVPPARRVKLEA